MHSDDARRILIEEAKNIKPARADTPEEAKYRAALKSDIAKLPKGAVVEIPSEWPE